MRLRCRRNRLARGLAADPERFVPWARGPGRTFVHISDDAGETFGRSVEIATAPFSGGYGMRGAVELPGGEVLLPLCDVPDYRRIFVVRSPDAGESWGPPVAAAEADGLMFEEPAPSLLASGQLLLGLRENSNRTIFTVHSDDAGRTWSEPRPTGIDGYPAHLLQLGDGRILCTYGFRRSPSPSAQRSRPTVGRRGANRYHFAMARRTRISATVYALHGRWAPPDDLLCPGRRRNDRDWGVALAPAGLSWKLNKSCVLPCPRGTPGCATRREASSNGGVDLRGVDEEARPAHRRQPLRSAPQARPIVPARFRFGRPTRRRPRPTKRRWQAARPTRCSVPQPVSAQPAFVGKVFGELVQKVKPQHLERASQGAKVCTSMALTLQSCARTSRTCRGCSAATSMTRATPSAGRRSAPAASGGHREVRRNDRIAVLDHA